MVVLLIIIIIILILIILLQVLRLYLFRPRVYTGPLRRARQALP